MFVLSLKSLKAKFILLFVAVTAIVLVGILIQGNSADKTNEPSSAVNANSYFATDTQSRLSFINSLGYTVKTQPDTVSDVIIPDEFDDVYENYNTLQKQAGLDLAKYKGCTAKKWTYTITNYPDYINKDCVKINLLIYNNRIIGGDICNVELNGFMTGLIKCQKSD